MIKKRCFLIILVLSFFGVLRAQTQFGPVTLQCEHLVNPLGIDASIPRLSWTLADNRKGALQSAYQVIIIDNNTEVWNTGKIASSQSLIIYEGRPLKPFTEYHWEVIVWDKDGKKYPATGKAVFETGMMHQKNWRGGWISDGIDIERKPAPYFRKSFILTKSIKEARAYIAAAGLYELYINGQKTGNHKLDPAYTRFDRRNLYITYDITDQLRSGKNAVGVLLGNGWYNHQSFAVWHFDKAPWRNRPAFCMDVRVTYTDGTTEVISTDRTWKTALGPIIFNSIYTAEHYDARLEIPGWNSADFVDSTWENAVDRAAPSQNIVAQVLYPIREVQKIDAQKMIGFNDSNYLFDLGRNISGISEIRVKGDSGTLIKLIHAERLGKDGNADLSNINVHYRPIDDSDPFQTDLFILKGSGIESFKPRFNYKGFQYVEVKSNKAVRLEKNSISGYFMHSDIPISGSIKSSNELINKIWSATNNSYLSNFFGYPTDCPQREKNGWTGDAVIALETGLYSFDGFTVYEKWLADHRDEQQSNGVLPAIIPTGGWGYQWANGPDWTSTIAIIPWTLYQFYGDSKPLADNYENIKVYVDHIDQLYPTGLTTWGLGDWVPVKSVSPVELTSSIYFYKDVDILAKTARLFGKQNDFEHYNALASKIKTAINKKYLNEQTGIYGSGLQTELSVPLYWGIVPEFLKQKVAGNLAAKIKADHVQLDVGILGAKAILNALSENGYADLAYQLASRKTYPSWGWWIVNGATTLYENWKIDAKRDISMNHIMFGDIGAWLYKGLGGIFPDPKNPGFKNVLLKPNFVTGLNEFNATHQGPYGTINSEWKKNNNKITYTCTIPANSTATLSLPIGWQLSLTPKIDGITLSDKSLQLASGRYSFMLKKEKH